MTPTNLGMTSAFYPSDMGEGSIEELVSLWVLGQRMVGMGELEVQGMFLAPDLGNLHPASKKPIAQAPLYICSHLCLGISES